MKWFDRTMVAAMVYVVLLPLVMGILAFWPQMPEILRRIGSQTGAAWVQAIGSLIVIGTGVGGLLYQEERRDREAAAQRELRASEVRFAAASTARTAGALSRAAVIHVAQRLAPLLPAAGEFLFLLRGHRTTEMVNALRDLQIAGLPTQIVEPVVAIRGGVYAINERITDVFRAEKEDIFPTFGRVEKLTSAGRVLGEVLADFDRLASILEREFDVRLERVVLDHRLAAFVSYSQSQTKSDPSAYDDGPPIAHLTPTKDPL